MKYRSALMLAALSLVACEAEPTKPSYDLKQVVAQAVADPARSAHRNAADERRKPAELILFSGVKPGDRVLDLIPGDGYWTRIFSKIVGPGGKVYAVWPENYAKVAQGNVATLRSLSGSADYPNVATDVQPTPQLSAPEPLDLVWTSQNYHDYPDEFMGRIDPAVLNKAVFAMLKPGGVFMVIDHKAAPGRGMADTEELHRIDPATVRQQVEAAGFVFEGESRALHNPADSLDIPVFDPKVRGRTSQFAYKFRKPD
jgi:predicted methyltransferase